MMKNQWKKKESSQSLESQQIRWENQRQGWRPSRPMTGRLSQPMTGRLSPHVTPVMVLSWQSLPTFSSSFPIFLHFLHCKGHDQRHLSCSFWPINRPGTISIWHQAFQRENQLFRNSLSAYRYLSFQYFVLLQFSI